jgi:glycosyltransferase involved in cell wall biosynthesis
VTGSAEDTSTDVDVRITGSHAAAFTGAAVVHREIAKRLPSLLPDWRVVDDFRPPESLLRRFFDTPTFESRVGITTSTPLPIRPHVTHLVPIVYDVRWRWTRGRLNRWYRHADLVRTARRADHVLTISHTVADHLRVLGITDYCDVRAIDLGPGQMQGVPPRADVDREPTVLLMGGASHKRNELAASLLTQLPELTRSWRVLGVSLSEQTEAILRSRFEPTRLSLHQGVSRDRLAELVSTATCYVALGLSEGLGFPYIEAAYLGCDVVAVRQPLTIEVLGDDGVLLDDPNPTPRQLYHAIVQTDPTRLARLQARAAARDWARTATQVADIVRPLLGS